MIGVVWRGHNSFENARRNMLPKWNESAGIQVFVQQTTSNAPTFATRYKKQWRRMIFLITLCLVMSLRFTSVVTCTGIMCVYGVLKILIRSCKTKELTQRSMFFAQCKHKRFMGLSFSVKTLWREQVILKCYTHGSSLNCMKMNKRTTSISEMQKATGLHIVL